MSTYPYEPTSTGKIPFRTYETAYEVFGDLSSGKTPLVVCHGGPGAPHDYLHPISGIVKTKGIPVIFYDQVGCGRSTILPNQPEGFWTVALFLEELDNVLAYFKIQSDYFLLGFSWGGMLSAEHSVRQPEGLKRLILSDTLPATVLWEEATVKLRGELPDNGGAILAKHEKEGTTESEEYKKFTELFILRHRCRVKPPPECAARTFRALDENSTVSKAMFGTSDTTGTLKGWSVIDRLHLINVPTLVIHGKYDVATNDVVQPFLDHIPDVRKVVFEESSHLPEVEEEEKYVQVVGDFLAN